MCNCACLTHFLCIKNSYAFPLITNLKNVSQMITQSYFAAMTFSNTLSVHHPTCLFLFPRMFEHSRYNHSNNSQFASYFAVHYDYSIHVGQMNEKHCSFINQFIFCFLPPIHFDVCLVDGIVLAVAML